MKPKITLVSWSSYPTETLYYLWEMARQNDPVDEPKVLAEKSKTDPVLQNRIRVAFEKIMNSNIPVGENIEFVFMLEGISISFREQMVRHRIGAKVGEKLGVDIVPELAKSTWWSQSMQVQDMSKFAEDEMFRIPESVERNPEALKVFKDFMANSAESYKQLSALGILKEDAREVIPLGAQHRISWGLNLFALQHIVNKRSCWMLQLGVWGPVILGMVEELATKIDPIFRKLSTPPCIKDEKYVGCPFPYHNQTRFNGEDPFPACSLYIHKEAQTNPLITLQQIEATVVRPDYLEKKVAQAAFWGRDAETGVLVK